MLYYDFISPGEEGFKGLMLDEFLSAGYYRMQHKIFTTHYTAFEEDGPVSPVFWLRTDLHKLKENKTATAIRKKCVPFLVEYKKAIINTEHEALYNDYRNHINFSTAPTCSEYLHAEDSENPYDSWMIEIRDAGLLIATGFFDKGRAAISGLINFYHPGYKKYSLGKFLMLKKIDYARANNISLYYTGYISVSNSKFDYKLFPDEQAIEVYLPVEKKWVRYDATGKRMLEAYFFNCINELLKS